MIVKDYKNNGESITYTLDYDIFSVKVEHKKTSEGVNVTDLTDLFDWLDEQEVSVLPLKYFLCFQDSLLLAGETLDFEMSKREMTQKEIEELADKLFDKNISEVFFRCIWKKMQVLSYMFRIFKTGYYKIWCHKGSVPQHKKDFKMSSL